MVGQQRHSPHRTAGLKAGNQLCRVVPFSAPKIEPALSFPKSKHSLSGNSLERPNAEIKRRTNVVGIFPNDAADTRLVGAMLLAQSDEWSLNRRYMQLEGLQTLTDTAPTRLPAVQR